MILHGLTRSLRRACQQRSSPSSRRESVPRLRFVFPTISDRKAFSSWSSKHSYCCFLVLSQVICALPSAISSLCLNPAGLAAVVDANVLGALLALFTSQKHRKVIKSGDTASRLGGGVDELMRHHPALRPIGIKAITNSLRRVCKMGGLSDIEEPIVEEEGEAKKEPKAEAADDTSLRMAVEGSDAPAPTSGDGTTESTQVAAMTSTTPADTAAENMEVSSEGAAVPREEKSDVAAAEQLANKVVPFVEPEIDSTVDTSILLDYMSNLGRFLETIFNNNEHGRHFIEAKGMDLMLKLLSLPELPSTFPCAPAAHSLTLAFRSLAANHTPALFRRVLESLIAKFQVLDELQPAWRDGSSFVKASGSFRFCPRFIIRTL